MPWTLGATWQLLVQLQQVNVNIGRLYQPMIYVSYRYDEDEAKSNRDNQEASRSALQRYLFYCNR